MQTDWRIGIGYDIHPVVGTRRLMLGGVMISERDGLGGHTDGDVVLHALIDAMLGAAGLPDIGEQFPDHDSALQGTQSRLLLERALALIGGAGWRVHQLDLTILAERPKLNDKKELIRKQLANWFELPQDHVGVKAKTNEGFDAVGHGEAIACHAAAILTRR